MPARRFQNVKFSLVAVAAAGILVGVSALERPAEGDAGSVLASSDASELYAAAYQSTVAASSGSGTTTASSTPVPVTTATAAAATATAAAATATPSATATTTARTSRGS